MSKKVTPPLLTESMRICVNDKKFFDIKLKPEDEVKRKIDFYIKNLEVKNGMELWTNRR